jgi:uroporphyrinogen III methyltransferase/synthase
VVNLKDSINWFESRSLFGKVVLVTRPQDQATEFVRRLSDLGARCILLPAIEILPPPSWKDLDRAIEDIAGYDWILFTSVNGAKYFFKRLYFAGKDARSIGSAKVGAIGPKTEEALVERGISPDLIPDDCLSEGIVES